MATDATGTPTSLGIPKYNTSSDPPSGKGFNAAMDAIDALLLARISAPSGIATGETSVWNGTTFVRSSVTKLSTASLSGYPWSNADINAAAAIARSKLDFGSGLVNADIAAAAAIARSKLDFGSGLVNADIAAAAAIGISKLAGYPSDVTKVLKGDGTWAVLSTTIPVGTTLPGSPADGDKAILVDSTTAPTYTWLFQYVSGISDANKWVFLGGSPLQAQSTSNFDNATTSFVDVTGSSLTLPRAGVYDIHAGGAAKKEFSTDVGGCQVAIDHNGSTIIVQEFYTQATFDYAGFSLDQRITASAASQVTKLRTKSGTTNTFRIDDWSIRAIPVRVA